MATLLLLGLFLSGRNSTAIGSSPAVPMVAMLLSNQSAAAYWCGSFPHAENRLPADTYEWTRRGHATSAISAIFEPRKTPIRPSPMAGQLPPLPAGSPVARSSAAPLFRRIDWLACALTAAAVGLGYYLTLAPEVTLEDSGELATGSFYAGIPHSPGYPVWTLYTWLWTVLAPFKNVAWRVALGEAASGAAAAGLLALLVSRSSSLLIQALEELKPLAARWEGAICLVAGFVAGLLLGYNGFMWSQSVIVEVYSFSVLSLMIVLVCLLRWINVPQQRRYLYYGLFFFGLCFTNHQTLIVAAMGIEAALAAADSRLGRNLFLGNSIIYLGLWLLSAEHVLTALAANPAVLVVFHVVGVCSLAAYGWFALLTRERPIEFVMDGAYAAFWLFLAAMPALGVFGALLALAALGVFLRLAWQTRARGGEWLVVLICGLAWVAGAAFYFYMPLACMTNPPMEWSYPRTPDGFIHALTRGQYEKTHPTDIIHHPGVFGLQLLSLGRGIIEEFNWVYAFVALAPFLFFRKFHRRERAWLIGLAAIYFCLGILLLILLNPPPDRNAQQLVRVFFTASHTCIALLVGCGLALTAAFMATHYQRFRRWGLMGRTGGGGSGAHLLYGNDAGHLFRRGRPVEPRAAAGLCRRGLLQPQSIWLARLCRLDPVGADAGFCGRSLVPSPARAAGPHPGPVCLDAPASHSHSLVGQ